MMIAAASAVAWAVLLFLQTPAPVADAVVETDVPIAVTIEWLSVAPDKDLETVVARRQAEIRSAASIPVSAAPDQFVRFYRAGSSPVTVSSGDLLGAAKWRIPRATPGGELFALVAPAEVAPKSYRIAGPTPREVLRPSNPGLSVAGLAPGEYEVTPIYEGGVDGTSLFATIREERSTFVRLNAQDVGAVNIQAEAESCAAATSLAVRRRLEPGSVDFKGSTEPTVFSTTDVAPCHWSVAGLRDGRYDISLRGAAGLEAYGAFDAHAQRTLTVTLTRSTASVSGRLTYNGKPLPHTRIRFSSSERGSAASVRSNDQGEYAVSLDSPGMYSVHIENDELPGPLNVVSIRNGTNTFDWSLTGGAIRVRVHSVDGTAGTGVTISPSDGAGMTFGRLAEGQDERVWRGMAFGSYDVVATRDHLASARMRVSIDVAHPDASVDVTLAPSRRTVRVSNEHGETVGAASFGPAVTATAVAPGVYSLEGVAPGTPISISASGHTSTCILTKDQDEVRDVVLYRGRPVVVRYQAPDAVRYSSPPGTISGVPGSECPVGLSAFGYQKLASTADGPGQFSIANFPLVSQVRLRFSGQEQVVKISDEGVLVVVKRTQTGQ